MQERYVLNILFLLTILINVKTVILQETIQYSPQQTDPRQRTVIMRLEPLADKPPFLNQAEPPRAIPQNSVQFHKNDQLESKPHTLPQSQQSNRMETQQKESPVQFAMPTVAAQQPVIPPLSSLSQPILNPREEATPPPAPPKNYHDQGIPGLTGSHPKGFAGAVEELRSQGIPIQGLPLEHVGGQAIHAPQNDALVQANPKFGNELNSLLEGSRGPFNPTGGSAPLPDAKPGDNGLIGLLSSSVRRFVKDSGVADALSNTLPNVLGTNQHVDAKGSLSSASHISHNSAASIGTTDSAVLSQSASGVRRQQSPAERALAGFASALGGGSSNGPAHAGNACQGYLLYYYILTDNVTDALLPATPEDFDLNKFMGRWFEVWVYKLGPEGNDPFGNKQYEYAIVSNWVKYPVTVLVRDPDTFKAKYEVEVLRWLEDQGFINGFIRAFNLLQPAS
uniref:Lipocalin domain-containing protein n=1 Tax=Meloidogyne hapla TaxID=6305 RepID=A0A1I8BNB4_MELHA